MTQERKFVRAPVLLAPRYRSPSSFEFVQGQCLDLSEGGMFIASDTPCESSTLIKFECQAEGEMLRGVARVVWRRTDGDASRPNGMGVKFVKLDPGGAELITKVIAGVRASVSDALPAQVSYRPEQEAPRSEPPKEEPAARSEPPRASPDASAESTPQAELPASVREPQEQEAAASMDTAEHSHDEVPLTRSGGPAKALWIALALVLGGVLLWLLR